MHEERIEALERRIKRLETYLKLEPMPLEESRGEELLVAKYGEIVSKIKAAQICGVSRATIYAMIQDGRLSSAGGNRISVRSIAHYIYGKRSVRA